jgi:hypothetical protein
MITAGIRLAAWCFILDSVRARVRAPAFDPQHQQIGFSNSTTACV